LARRRPAEAADYIDSHEVEWESLARQDPHDAADIIEALEEEAAGKLLEGLEPDATAAVLEELHDEVAADILEGLDVAEAAAAVGRLSAEEAADIVGHLEPEARTAIFAALEGSAVDEILDLLKYPPDSAGGLMTPDPATLRSGLTSGEAIEALRRLHEQYEDLTYVYVTEHDGRLIGVVSFRDLVFARPHTGLDDVMVPNPVAVRAETDREQVAELIQRYGLLAMPVIDHRGSLLGVIPIDNVLESVQREATEDIAAMVGAGPEETIYTPFQRSVRHRLPWLIVNLGTALVVTFTISRFEPVISRLAVLAAYMPVVASLGGNSGAQSQAVLIRAMVMDTIPYSAARRVMAREALIGLINGIVVGSLSAVIAMSFTGDVAIGVVIGLAALANLVAANLAGSGIPILLERLGKDPALASNIFMTLVTDLVGFGGFLAIATALL
jgi:magnesium transporter